MRISWVAILALSLGFNVALAADDCMNPTALIELDAEWERSLLELDEDWLESHLADSFIWVHSAASLVDTKVSLLARASFLRLRDPSTRSRVQSDVEARVPGQTGVVTGFTVVDRDSRPTRYHFQRTWVYASGQCRLLANHTMFAPPDEGLKGGGSRQ